jgi:hypothetical protein
MCLMIFHYWKYYDHIHTLLVIIPINISMKYCKYGGDMNTMGMIV